MVCFLKLWKIKSIIFKISFSNLILLTQDRQWRRGRCWGHLTIHMMRVQSLVTTWGPGVRSPAPCQRSPGMEPWHRIPQPDLWISRIIQTATFSRMTAFSTYYPSECDLDSGLLVCWSAGLTEDRSLDSPMSQHAPAWSLLIPDQLRSSSSSAPALSYCHAISGARKWKIQFPSTCYKQHQMNIRWGKFSDCSIGSECRAEWGFSVLTINS